MAAELSTVVPDYHETILMMHNMLDPKQMEFIALALNSIEHYFSNKLALAAISHQSLQSHGIAKRDTTGVDISNRLRSVIGWDLDIAMTEYEEGEIGVSLRTRDENMYDLTKIVTPLGGGGHKAAAGIYLKMDLESAKKLLLDTIQKVYPHLGTP
jgi:nanoRNase/pAp phosphatase (c-di-AMP/oligoRNAs hydrolase)